MAKVQQKLCKINDARHIVVTQPMRLSFPKVFTPVLNELSNKLEYSCDLIAENEEDLKAPYKGKKKQTVSVMRALNNARIDQWGEKDSWPKFTFKSIKNGDDNINKKEDEPYAGYAGKKYLTAKSGEKFPPKVVGKDGKPLAEEDLYGGCMVRAVLIARPVVFGKTIGVRWILQQLMKVEDGERFGGGGVQDMFDVSEDDEEDVDADEEGDNEDW